MIDIVDVHSPDDLERVRELFREYSNFLGVDLSFQRFEDELSSLPGSYAPPGGTLLLAKDGSLSLGCGALRPFGAPERRTCEMKRLYVRPAAQGLGLGQRLAELLIQRGVDLGYGTMLLDTLDSLRSAVRLYEQLGFMRVPPYYDNPLPGVSYWMLDLYNWGHSQQECFD